MTALPLEPRVKSSEGMDDGGAKYLMGGVVVDRAQVMPGGQPGTGFGVQDKPLGQPGTDTVVVAVVVARSAASAAGDMEPPPPPLEYDMVGVGVGVETFLTDAGLQSVVAG